MACNCSNTPRPPCISETPIVIEELATIPKCGCVESGDCCNGSFPDGAVIDPEAISSVKSCGANLEAKWTDGVCENDGVTLLARKGKKLSRFTKSGFLRLMNGKASVVDYIPVQIRKLWHRWYKPPGSTLPVLGDPNPYPYSVIGDPEGNLFALTGPSGNDATHFWNSELKQWEVRPIQEVPTCTKGQLTPLSGIELVGFKAIPINGDADAKRCLARLFGQGIVVLNTAPSTATECVCEGCQEIPAESSIATPIPFPDDDDEDNVYSFKWDSVNGPRWVLDS